ncbi:efflux transporter outer membrane subunit [Celerinatantimonas diazotrophica]|uniref:NodT family efflux transporter outer membrane factor (OMF) lipoprotein n=1 Tax=Celerinatantimonas diazotrophica TaxID=412034 RepID=A0A4R1J899_9GAMM|nr:efflux transporter outer membrane subunit [Celerinatantimonas diazotrophica]TCK46782.1 NodT family efflux transporter outer membrane factor (OMF) lipoprotein [Celerinatantimonas diazotrophica]CAG9295485.1 Outer membrane protein OprM [Celerinatantimonas diazotrophica]
MKDNRLQTITALGRLTILGLVMASLTGCAMVGPDYKPPKTVTLGNQYKAAKGWSVATPQAAQNKGPWWQVYHDATLNKLMKQVAINNQNVAQYLAQYQKARALAQAAGANLAPNVSLSLSSSRAQKGQILSNNHSLQGNVSWEVDLWGKLRRTRQEERASAQSSAAELASATLSAQSELAQDYFELRIFDAKIKLYQQNIEIYQRYLNVVENQYKAGKETRDALAQARTQLHGARSSKLNLVWQRAQMENAIAVLIGRSASNFSIKPVDFKYELPKIPTALPSQLLQRRPDIAQAERNVAAANAAVGVAIAGYFPDVTLSASGGFSSSHWADLLKWPARMWSIGPSITETLLDFGRTRAEVRQAKASYRASVASYRQSVLNAIKEVEDYLIESHVLAQELKEQQQATASAKESARITYNQYVAGMIDYLNVATTQATSLNQQQSLLSLQQTQLINSVQLIAALGGGWERSELPGMRRSVRVNQDAAKSHE